MGFENLFVKKSTEENLSGDGRDTNEEELSAYGKQRRKTLLGMGALAVGAGLNLHEAQASATAEQFAPLNTPEGKEHNVERIKAYQDWLIKYRYILEDENSSREAMDAVLFFNANGTSYLPVLERKYLQETELDHENLFRRNGSFPAFQIRTEGSESVPAHTEIRFSNQDNIENGTLKGYGNGFVLDGGMITAEHVANDIDPEAFVCASSPEDGFDIAGLSLNDIDDKNGIKENALLINLPIDRQMRKRDLHGEFIDITGIHETRGTGPDNSDITSGVLVKITPAIITHYFKDIFSDSDADFKKIILNSYICIVPPRDVNGDGVANGFDVSGLSGSPIFSDSETSQNVLSPCGIVWGSTEIDDLTNSVSYTMVAVHGPDALIEMSDTVQTILSGFMDETEFPGKRALTFKVQEALNTLGYGVVVDGDYGGNTQEAVFAFQKKVFDRDILKAAVLLGDVDRRTWDMLFPDEAGVNREKLYELFNNV